MSDQTVITVHQPAPMQVTVGITGLHTSENDRLLAEAAAESAEADAALTAADAIATAADRVVTTQDAIDTAADAVATAADRVVTTQDALDTAADVVLTNADVVTTQADAATTTQDAIDTTADAVATAADRVVTTQDAIDTAADVVLTNADVVLTNADVVSTGLDVGYSEEWATKAEDSLISAAAGGDEATDYSALHHSAKAAATAAAAVLASDHLKTDGTAGLVLRTSRLFLNDGGTADTITAELEDKWNGDDISVSGDIAHDTTLDGFTVSASGTSITFAVAATAIAIVAATIYLNTATVPYMVSASVVGGEIRILLLGIDDATAVDIAAALDNGAGTIKIDLAYITEEVV